MSCVGEIMESAVGQNRRVLSPRNQKQSDWEKALTEFLESWKGKKTTIGAIATGSRVAGVATEYSDVDVHIILSNKTKWRERGLTNVNGLVIEYFANPMRQLKKYLKTDRKEGRKECARMFALGKIVLDKRGDARKLQRLGQRYLRRSLPKVDRSLIENSKYHLWDGLDELKALENQRLPGFEYAYYVVLHELLKNYARFLGAEMWAVGKIWRFLHSPDYRRKQRIAAFPDQPFVKMFLIALDEPTLRSIEKLTRHVHRRMGGFHVENWKLRAPLE
jgi:hypothetical protein